MTNKINIFWFRRDLRLSDNAGLFYALNSGTRVLPVFIFDAEILGKLVSKTDARVTFIYRQIEILKSEIEKQGSSLLVLHSTAKNAFSFLLNNYKINEVFANSDYEPQSVTRDFEINELLEKHGSKLLLFKDQVIFEKNEVIKNDGKPYTVFTPYSKKWKMQLHAVRLFNSENLIHNFWPTRLFNLPLLSELGFAASEIPIPKNELNDSILRNYETTRNYPSVNGTSKLGIHIRYGTIGIRNLVQRAQQISEVFLNELIWREFFMQILWHFPEVSDRAFKARYRLIPWRFDEEDFKKWCKGKTGFSLVDAGMRELNATGFMHNRVRMVVASFLTKHLLIDWRWGEAYFAEKLLDFELSSNNGNWQWAAGCGCDAAPYFRIFNPTAQQKKFDPRFEYIKKWVPEFGTSSYPEPMIEHKFARERAIKFFKKHLK